MEQEALRVSLVNRDPAAYRYFVDTYRDKIFHIALGFLQDRDDAEDITQDVFLEVFRSIGNFRGDALLSTWIYRITVNKSMNFLKRKKRKNLLENIESLFFSQKEESRALSHNKSPMPDEELERQELAGQLKTALDRLPVNQRKAFTLFQYEDLSYQEVAVVMEVSLSSVESLIHRARKNLQASLSDVYKKHLGGRKF